MLDPVLHNGVTPALSLETGVAVLAVGAAVLFIIAYDIYRQQWVGGD